MDARSRTALTAVAVVLFAGSPSSAEAAAVDPGPRVPTAADLAGHTYTAVAFYADGKVRALAERRSVRIRFAKDRESLSANFGCNRISGTFTVEGGRFRTPGLAMTRMYCTETARQEQELIELVESEPRIRLRGSRLVLRGDGARLVLRDRQVT